MKRVFVQQRLGVLGDTMSSNALQEVKESTLESIQIYQELVDRLCDKQVYSIVSDCWSETMRLDRSI